MKARPLFAQAVKFPPRCFAYCLAVLLLFVATAAPQSQPDASPKAGCGPPKYCARTDQRVEPYPQKPPAIGPAGSMINDPTFGSRILRVTDGRSDPTQAGLPLYTPSSPEQNSWNQ